MFNLIDQISAGPVKETYDLNLYNAFIHEIGKFHQRLLSTEKQLDRTGGLYVIPEEVKKKLQHQIYSLYDNIFMDIENLHNTSFEVTMKRKTK